jgi:acetyl esterase/lipase
MYDKMKICGIAILFMALISLACIENTQVSPSVLPTSGLPQPTLTATPTPTKTNTPTPTSTNTPTEEPTATPIPTQIPMDYDVGTHGWIYALPVLMAHPQDNASVSILVPSMMYKAGLTYRQLVDAVGYAGPGSSHIDSVVALAPRADSEGANLLIYVPEGNTTSPSVPISETIFLEQYLDEFIAVGLEHPSLVLNYGPSLELVSDPDTWRFHRHYDLDVERVCNLASMLPDGSFWSLRINTPENMYANDAVGFRAAIQEYVNAIHCGNTTIRILMHLSLQPRSANPVGVEQFMFYAKAAEGLYDQLYAGIDYPFPNDPYYDEQGSIEAFTEVLALTGAGGIEPTPIPTDTPTPTSAPILPVVYHDLSYGEYPQNVLDLYIPSGTGNFPVVAWFHGGGMTSGDKTMEREKAELLNANGIAVASANYRFVPSVYMPEQIYDAKAVIRWLRANASQYNLNPDKIGVAGGSAGAVISSIIATSGDNPELEGTVGAYEGLYSSRVQAGVALAGVYDFRSYLHGIVRFCGTKPPDVEYPGCFLDGDSNGKGDFFHCWLNQPSCLHTLDLSSAIWGVTPDDPPISLWVGISDDTPYALEDHQNFYQALLDSGIDTSLHIEETPECVEHGTMWPCIEQMVIDWLVDKLGGMNE